MSQKYISKFSGKDLDKAVSYSLELQATTNHKNIGITPDDKVDLNSLTELGTYTIYNYLNSYDDTLSSNAIEMEVFYIDDNTIGQRYTARQDSVQRLYDKLTSLWSEWSATNSNDFVIVSGDTEVTVKKKTMILRTFNEREIDSAKE